MQCILLRGHNLAHNIEDTDLKFFLILFPFWNKINSSAAPSLHENNCPSDALLEENISMVHLIFFLFFHEYLKHIAVFWNCYMIVHSSVTGLTYNIALDCTFVFFSSFHQRTGDLSTLTFILDSLCL